MRFSHFGVALLATTALASVHCEESNRESEGRQSSHEPRILEAAPPIHPAPEDVEPTPLIGDFVSLISLEEALERTNGLPYETNMNRTTPKRGTCPGQHFLELVIKRYEDLGSQGTLYLQFYDDKLTRAWLKTGDHEGYRQRYAELHGIERRNRWRPAYVKPATRILAAVMGNLGLIVRDTRMWANVKTTDLACRFQRQQERGMTAGAEN